MPKTEVISYVPHEAQKLIHSSRARIKVICAGRQFGKTMYCPHELMYKLYPPFEPVPGKPWILPGRRISNQRGWVIAPTYKLLDQMKEFLMPLFDPFIVKEEKTKNRIWLLDGHSIDFRSADTPNLVSSSLHWLIADECRFYDPILWEKCLQPCLMRHKGWALLISTPNDYRDWFQKVWETGQNPDYPDYESWHFTSYDNPYLDPEEIDKKKLTMPERQFKQEIMAEWIDSDSTFFKGLDKCIMKNVSSLRLKDLKKEEKLSLVTDKIWSRSYDCKKCGHIFLLKADNSRRFCPLCRTEIEDITEEQATYYTGFDPARKNDFSVVTTIQYLPLENKFRQIFVDRMSDTAWDIQERKIKEISVEFGGVINMDATGVGQPFCEILQSAGVPVNGVVFANKIKMQMMSKLAVFIEKGLIDLLDIPEQTKEFNNIQMDQTAEGNWRIHAPKGEFDDFVMALALATWSAPIIYEYDDFSDLLR